MFHKAVACNLIAIISSSLTKIDDIHHCCLMKVISLRNLFVNLDVISRNKIRFIMLTEKVFAEIAFYLSAELDFHEL